MRIPDWPPRRAGWIRSVRSALAVLQFAPWPIAARLLHFAGLPGWWHLLFADSVAAYSSLAQALIALHDPAVARVDCAIVRGLHLPWRDKRLHRSPPVNRPA